MTAGTGIPKKTKVHCNNCSGETNHEVLHVEQTSWEDERHHVTGGDTYSTLRCCGCEKIRLRHSSWCSEDDDPHVTYFPPSIFRKQPEWFQQLWLDLGSDDEFVYKRLEEIYVAIQHNLLSLAAMGVRSLLERIMITKAGDLGTFVQNIAAFEKLGFVSSKQRERLEAILEAGHATIHRAYEPTRDDVVTLVDLTEHIVQTVYLHEPRIVELKKRVPARTKKK